MTRPVISSLSGAAALSVVRPNVGSLVDGKEVVMLDGRSTLGLGQLAALTQQVEQEWAAGLGWEAEILERCDCCGELIGFVHPEEREAAEQWAAWVRRSGEISRLGGRGTGWPDRPGEMSTGTPGWSRMRLEDLDLDLDV